MLKFKKQFENHNIVLNSGLLINRESISREAAQKALKGNAGFAYMLEEAEVEPVAVADSTEPPTQPGTGGGGAGDPRPKTNSVKNKKK